MMLSDYKLRVLCKTSDGAIEAEQFQKALDVSADDPVAVEFYINGETTKIEIPREECEYYAQIAKDEAAPEKELLQYINPQMHFWVRYNREKMCLRLKESLLKYHEDHKVPGQGVVIMWPLCMPDQIPLEVIEKYLRKYS